MDLVVQPTHQVIVVDVSSSVLQRDDDNYAANMTTDQSIPMTMLWDMTTIVTNVSTNYSDNIPESDNNWPALFLVIIILCTVMGNVLVCLAIMTDKKLQSITNYFLMSLAIADLMVSLLVMPFGIIVEFAGHWPYGVLLCDMYIFFDVLCCTSSIMHLCTISVDRYLAITRPIKHASKYRYSCQRVVVKITLVWIISIGLSCPLIALGMTDATNVLNQYSCTLTNEYFKLYGSIVAFFIPLAIVVITYSLTVHKLRKKARLCCDKPSNSAVLRKYSFRSHSSSQFGRHFGVTSANKRYSYNRGSTSSCQEGSNSSRSNSLPMQPMSHQNGNDTLHKYNSTPRANYHGASQPLRKTMSNASRTSAVSINNERRATKVLGLVFFFFVICWAPFFIFNVLSVLCKSCYFPSFLMDFCLWLGYVASMINPILYTVFNKRFRAAFVATLTCSQRQLKAKDHTRCLIARNSAQVDNDSTLPRSPKIFAPNRAQYGPKIPGYGPKIPGYGPKIPGYGPKIPGYGPKIPGYGPKIPGYGPNIPGYRSEIPGYGPKIPRFQNMIGLIQGTKC
ncbi:5-hydroxytryptamine receptor 2C-like [Glandiceps talaboti]